MPRTCTVCRSPDVEAINQALVRGEPERSVAARYGALSRDAMHRHASAHLPVAEVDTGAGESLLRDVRMLERRVLAILDDAEGDGERKTALLAARELTRLYDLRARITAPAVLPAEIEQQVTALATALGQDPGQALLRFRTVAERNGYLLPDRA